jgi:hypothetical protein
VSHFVGGPGDARERIGELAESWRAARRKRPPTASTSIANEAHNAVIDAKSSFRLGRVCMVRYMPIDANNDSVSVKSNGRPNSPSMRRRSEADACVALRPVQARNSSTIGRSASSCQPRW